MTVALASSSDTVSIALMEIVDNAIMLVIPGAMDAGLDEFTFWGSLALSLVIAGLAAFRVVRWLIARGRGHAVVHDYRARVAGPHADHDPARVRAGCRAAAADERRTGRGRGAQRPISSSVRHFPGNRDDWRPGHVRDASAASSG